MILCLDIGNSQLYGGVFAGEQLQLNFRHDSRHSATSDQLGIFLKTVLKENHIDTSKIQDIAICSVVPNLEYSLRAACIKYFSTTPFFLNIESQMDLTIKYQNPLEVGADRIANAIAATHLYPNEHTIIVDFGTATTCCAVSDNKEYLGGVILAGMRLSMDALETHTAKLASVEIIKPQRILGKSTRESIQSGLYYGQFAAIKEICDGIRRENFNSKPVNIIGTGGFAHLFSQEKYFSHIEPDLVLQGLRLAFQLNH